MNWEWTSLHGGSVKLTFRVIFNDIYIYIHINSYIYIQKIVTTEDRHDRRETLCLV